MEAVLLEPQVKSRTTDLRRCKFWNFCYHKPLELNCSSSFGSFSYLISRAFIRKDPFYRKSIDVYLEILETSRKANSQDFELFSLKFELRARIWMRRRITVAVVLRFWCAALFRNAAAALCLWLNKIPATHTLPLVHCSPALTPCILIDRAIHTVVIIVGK